jgi:hypothetical protein
MKIILTEEQMLSLQEEIVDYTSEGREEIISKAVENLSVAQKYSEKYKSIILGTSVGDVMNDFEKYLELLQRMKSSVEQIDRKSNQYYKLYDMYGMVELNDIQSQLENIGYKIGEYHDILEQMLSFSKNHRD